ncbi:MAG: hypothetical protein LKK25_05625 [Sphaerochaeta sp.]|jgi:hypothetical protein|nr:hypothetical protein [Sphaerochaeta sp.]MCI2104352.1 hypothetical protein [Sphaerochaeta sp.]MCI2128859.1 hypothetical protein [Sphaerochaeta sp.]
MIDPFSRMLVCDRKEPLWAFSRAQNALLTARVAEVEAFNTYGPRDHRFLNRLLDLAQAEQTAKEYDRSLESCLAFDRYAKGSGMLPLRLENIHLIIQTQLAKGDLIEADELSSAILKETHGTVLGQWGSFWRLKILSLRADILKEKGLPALERKTREDVLASFAGEFGTNLFETQILRMYLGECEERLKAWNDARGDYESVYAAFQINGWFSTAEDKISLLAHWHRVLYRVGDTERAMETRFWILNMLKRAFPTGTPQRKQVITYLRDSARDERETPEHSLSSHPRPSIRW